MYQGFRTLLTMSDRAKTVGKLRTELNHMGIPLHSIPFHSLRPTDTSAHDVRTFYVSRLNFQHSTARQQGPSQRQTFTGRPADTPINRVLRLRRLYPRYGPSNVQWSPSARTDNCIVMPPTGNQSGAVTMLSLTAGKIATRDTPLESIKHHCYIYLVFTI
jgi:hypothetical protein